MRAGSTGGKALSANVYSERVAEGGQESALGHAQAHGDRHQGDQGDAAEEAEGEDLGAEGEGHAGLLEGWQCRLTRKCGFRHPESAPRLTRADNGRFQAKRFHCRSI